jgi:hypothetical protein
MTNNCLNKWLISEEEEEEFWEDWEEDEEEEEEDPLEEDPCTSAENFVTLDDFIKHCLGDDLGDEEEDEENP